MRGGQPALRLLRRVDRATTLPLLAILGQAAATLEGVRPASTPNGQVLVVGPVGSLHVARTEHEVVAARTRLRAREIGQVVCDLSREANGRAGAVGENQSGGSLGKIRDRDRVRVWAIGEADFTVGGT